MGKTQWAFSWHTIGCSTFDANYLLQCDCTGEFLEMSKSPVTHILNMKEQGKVLGFRSQGFNGLGKRSLGLDSNQHHYIQINNYM